MILKPGDAECGLGVRLVENINHQALQFQSAVSALKERALSAVWRVRTTVAVRRVLIRVVHDQGFERSERWGASCKALADGQTTTDMYVLQAVDDGLSEVAINEPIEANQECRIQVVRFQGPTAELRYGEIFMVKAEDEVAPKPVSVMTRAAEQARQIMDLVRSGVVTTEQMRQLLELDRTAQEEQAWEEALARLQASRPVPPQPPAPEPPAPTRRFAKREDV